MTTQAYNVPVILPDLRREESYHQIVDALEYLDAVANDIFNRISCRVADSRDQLTTINNRINVAQAKIDKLRSSSSRATRVFSSPKYPAPEKVVEYETIYQDVSPMLQKVRRTKSEIESRLVEVTPEVINSKKEPFVFHLRRKQSTREAVLQDDPEQGEGLGSLPRHLPSVSSLLLFNTSENPYKKYVILDPLSGATTKTREIIEGESGLSEAPFTITQGEELDRGPQDSIMYVPLMLELPELDVPELLPHLHQVATDMLYTADVGASIAPSLANTTVPELPNLADPDAPAGNEPIPPPSQPQPGTEGPPPPGPPPPAPPPPPPASPPPPPPPHPESSDEEVEPPEGGGGGDGRADLMAEIRKAGGASKAGLKNAKNRKHERKAHKKEVEAAEEGGDLLTDLSAALSRRRKAMSGKEKEDRREERREEQPHNLGGGSMMDNISRMIPPPLAGGNKGDGHESDEVEW